MNVNFLLQLKTKMRFFAPVERQIADAILADAATFPTLSLKAFADAAGVSQGSVVNFAKRHAGGGFPHLKMLVALALSDVQTDHTVDSSDSVRTALVKTAASTGIAFDQTCARNSEEVLSRVVDRILGARKVEIYGVFRSAAVATDFCYQLLGLGVPAAFVSDILTCAISSSMLEASDLVVAVSSSGRTKDVYDAVKAARQKGVPVIALTGDASSPIAQMADEVLLAASGDDEGASSVRASQMLLADAICATIRARQSETEQKRYIAIRKILSSHNVKEGEQ